MVLTEDAPWLWLPLAPRQNKEQGVGRRQVVGQRGSTEQLQAGRSDVQLHITNSSSRSNARPIQTYRRGAFYSAIKLHDF